MSTKADLSSSQLVIMGLSFSLCSNDFPKWRPYPKLFNETLRVSLAFFTLIHSIKQACFASSHKKSSDLRRSFVAWDCRLHFVAPTSLNGVLTQSFSTNRFAFRWLFLRSSTQSSKLVSRPRIKKAPTCVEAL